MDRSAQLDAVIDSLSQLVAILAHDPHCQWRRHFETCLRHAQDLKAQGFDQVSLNELSGSIRFVYGGMGSFNDYVPVIGGKDGSFSVIQGMENFESVAGNVYEQALNLMVIGDVSNLKFDSDTPACRSTGR